MRIKVLAILLIAISSTAFRQTGIRDRTQISGQVRPPAGAAHAEHILVRLERFVGGVVEEVRTDRLGKFSFSGLLPEHYVVVAGAPGFRDVREEVDTRTARNAYVMLQLSVPLETVHSNETIAVIDAKMPEGARKEFEKGRTALLIDKKPKEGIQYLEKAVSAYPEFAEGHLLLGTAYMEVDRWDKAEIELRRTLEITPEASAALFALGEVLLHNKEYDKAEKALQDGLTLEKDSWQGHLALSRVYWATGNLAKAGPEVGRAIQLKPDLAEAYLLAGNILLRARQAAPALQMFEEYLRLEPKGKYAAETRSLIERIKKSIQK